MDLAALREEYTREGLSRKNLDKDPFQQFEHWFRQALNSEVVTPNAMSLATVASSGQPSQRTVLLKYFDEEGLVFFTNYESRKAREIAGNPQVSLLFYWPELERQVHIAGRSEQVSAGESLKYFMSRPRGSQIGAWVSNQSSVIGSRQLLMAKFEELKRKFRNHEVPLPSFWGGYRVAPSSFEFWQGRPNRLHDRFLYSRRENGGWGLERLAP
ncbi:MAG: pyridoxamine 5'-phosphate oxidase [Phaeodactylibacter sp.]|nr:pyridoxamine 5'-phosphate oxidase [Phaeodactylibacter sp.]MCB9264837.1 pyridoxamine 5'-phosphate oxidase [Lewinellaceae bacterium]MCB9286399.1 pyridoxamine 5'-phosphate oxidase [Lewinellaceae bacterium]